MLVQLKNSDTHRKCKKNSLWFHFSLSFLSGGGLVRKIDFLFEEFAAWKPIYSSRHFIYSFFFFLIQWCNGKASKKQRECLKFWRWCALKRKSSNEAIFEWAVNFELQIQNNQSCSLRNIIHPQFDSNFSAKPKFRIGKS